MRYFLLLPQEGGLPSHIVAEVVRESGDELHRELSLAGAIGGADSRIVTEAELGDSAAGREALSRWVADDDAVFDEHTRRIIDGLASQGGRGRARLRLVRLEVADQVREALEISVEHSHSEDNTDLIKATPPSIERPRGVRVETEEKET